MPSERTGSSSLFFRLAADTLDIALARLVERFTGGVAGIAERSAAARKRERADGERLR